MENNMKKPNEAMQREFGMIEIKETEYQELLRIKETYDNLVSGEVGKTIKEYEKYLKDYRVITLSGQSYRLDDLAQWKQIKFHIKTQAKKIEELVKKIITIFELKQNLSIRENAEEWNMRANLKREIRTLSEKFDSVFCKKHRSRKIFDKTDFYCPVCREKGKNFPKELIDSE